MKLPVYQEIKLSAYMKSAEIKKQLLAADTSNIPIYINFHKIDHHQRLEFSHTISNALSELGRTSVFPYPTYIIIEDKLPIHFNNIIQIQSIEDLPKFFQRGHRSPRSKEASILAKLEVLSEKLRNTAIQAKIATVEDELDVQNDIYLKAMELEQINNILNKLNEKKSER